VGYDLKNIVKQIDDYNLNLNHDIKIAQWLINSELKRLLPSKNLANHFQNPSSQR